MPASKEVPTMTPEQFEREKKYQAVMSVARRMLAVGILTCEEYRVIDTKMRAKYVPVFSVLYPL
jgi:hypothetical protein